ncbi:terpene synthase family protein [Streptomyces vinaceus]|uniref:terpene synthase family protein n=1 Tax=Streptomyces vinaceus TaxID=1960 RepID=UPI003686A0BE
MRPDATDSGAEPVLCQPFTARWYPQAERAGMESLNWLGAFGIAWPPGQWAEIERERAGYWWGLFDPGAVDHERFRLGADLLTAIFPFDDAYSGRYARARPGDAAAWAGRWTRLLDDPLYAEPCDHPLTAPMVDVLARAAGLATPMQYRRFTDALKSYITTLAWEFEGRDTTIRRSLAEAAACRFYTSGCAGIIAVLPITHGLHIDEETFHCGVFRAYTEAAVLVMTLYNDLFSYAKEKTETPDDVSILSAAVHEDGGSVFRSLRRVITLHNQAMDRIVRLGTVLRGLGSPATTAFTKAVEEQVAGNFEFGRMSSRYRNGEHALPPYRVTRTVPPAASEPVAVATFRWWWDPAALTLPLTSWARSEPLGELGGTAGL